MNASLSLDLDNQWSYMKTHGDEGWQQYPSYLPTLIPRTMAMLDDLGLKITYFVVGLDADAPENADVLAALAPAGHEIGNHSYNHEPWMHRRPPSEIEDEIARAEASIFSATGMRPRGFRGPGFVRSNEMHRILARRGYLYDASTLPTFIGPLARAYYFRTAHLQKGDLQERSSLFGAWHDGLLPNRPYRINTPDGYLLQIPVTTMPGFRVPIHVSYLLYIASRSTESALAYFRFALALCKQTRTVPSILLHPLDFLGADDCPELAFFPAMQMRSMEKLRFVRKALTVLRERFEVGPLAETALQAFPKYSQHYEAG